MATTVRPRISGEFLKANQRRRILDGLARSVVECGYPATTVTDIVREAGIARNTFYDCFASKEECARGLFKLVTPVLDVERADIEVGPYVLALEIAARLKLNLPLAASALISDAEQLLDLEVEVEPFDDNDPSSDFADPILSKLPPGRHGLPRDFVAENHFTRLLAGTARAVYEHGYAGATIEQIVDVAATSRRTFYDHFDGKDGAVEALLYLATPRSFNVESGLGSLWAEIVAAAFCGDEVGSESLRRQGFAALGIVGAQLATSVAA